MMNNVIDYTIGFSTEEVEAILAVQKAELLKTQQAYASDGSSVNKRKLEEIHAIIQSCQTALVKLDPTTYGTKRTSIQAGSVGYMEK